MICPLIHSFIRQSFNKCFLSPFFWLWDYSSKLQQLLPSQSSQSSLNMMVQCEFNPGKRGIGIALSLGDPDPPDLWGLVLSDKYSLHTFFCLFRSSGAVSEAGALVGLA